MAALGALDLRFAVFVVRGNRPVSMAPFGVLRVLFIGTAHGPARLELRHCRTSWHTSENHRWWSAAASMIALPYGFWSMLTYLGTRVRSTPEPPESESPLRLLGVSCPSRYSQVLARPLMVGIVVLSPLAGVVNATRLVSLLLSPLIVWRFGGRTQATADAPLVESWGELSANRMEPTNVRMALSYGPEQA